MMKRRIIRADALNWAIQEWQEGGGTVERGRYAGQAKQSRWKAPECFFPTLQDAAKRMLSEEIADGWTGEKLSECIASAEARVLAHLDSLFQDQKEDLLVGILQGKGYKVTTGEKGRTSYSEESD